MDVRFSSVATGANARRGMWDASVDVVTEGNQGMLCVMEFVQVKRCSSVFEKSGSETRL